MCQSLSSTRLSPCKGTRPGIGWGFAKKSPTAPLERELASHGFISALFNDSSRMALNSAFAFHSGIFAAFATR